MTEFPDLPDAQTEELRDELILLASRGKIKYTEKFLKKASPKQLDRIKHEHDRQQTEVVDELITRYVIGGLTSLMRSYEYIDEKECDDMKKTLLDNDLVKRAIGEFSGYLTRNIRYIGIEVVAAVATGYVINKKYGEQNQHTAPSGPGSEERQDSE